MRHLLMIVACLVLSAACTNNTSAPKATKGNPTAIEHQAGAPKKEIVPDFRNVCWGMSAKEVKEYEKGSPLETKKDGATEILVYKDKVAGLNCAVCYVLVKDKLVRAKCVNTEKHTNETDYLQDFDALKEALTQKYGSPEEDKAYWKDELFKDQPSDWGLAVSIGHLQKFAKWGNSRTAITLALMGDNYQISSGVGYQSKELESFEKNTKREEDQKKF